jgi:hypothetical protein
MVSFIITLLLTFSPLAPVDGADRVQWSALAWLTMYASLMIAQLLWSISRRATHRRRPSST